MFQEGIRKKMWTIPTIEEIYNEYHKQKFFQRNGIYPKTIKNFDSLLNDSKKKEFLLRFQNMIKRNRNVVNWKLYILAIAEVTQGNFDLSILGTLKGTKIYRGYIEYKQKKNLEEVDILNEVKRSLAVISNYVGAQEIKLKDYYYENFETSPVALQHIFSDLVSPYLYAILPSQLAYKLLNYNDECFYDLFKCDKNEFFETVINPLHDNALKYKKIQEAAIKIEKTFSMI